MLSALLLLASSALAPSSIVAEFDAQSEVLMVRYCGAPDAGWLLRAEHHAVTPVISPSPTSRTRRTLRFSSDQDCVELRHDLAAIADSRTRDVGYRVGDDLLTWAWSWWWQPEGGPVEVQFKLPTGWQLSTPWPSCEAKSASNCFVLGSTPSDFPALISLGRFPLQSRGVGKSVVEVAILGRLSASQRAIFAEYANASVALIRDGMGSFPGPRLQLQIVPIPSRQSGVHWGQVYRGGYGGVQLFINPTASAAELAEDWVLAHELSHLRHPYLGSERGRWLAEGLASYYQNVLRARSGQLSAQVAWQKLLAGFERGRGVAQGQTLDRVASDMDQSRHYMRVYWSGAAFWLKVDLALRRNGSDLDRELRSFAERHLPAKREWLPAEFLSALDKQLERTFIAELANQAGAELEFPDVSAELAELGLLWDGRKLALRADPKQQSLRKAIFAPR